MTRDDIKRAIARTGATTVQCGLEANERTTVTVLGQDVYLAMCAEIYELWAVDDAARKVKASGVLCDPGCCGDNCGCAELRAALKAYDEEIR